MGLGNGSGITIGNTGFNTVAVSGQTDIVADNRGTLTVEGSGNVTVSTDPATQKLIIFSSAGGGTGTVTSISAGGGLTASTNPITTTGDISIANTAVSAGSYNYATITVNSRGQLTAASSNTAVTSVSAGAGLIASSNPITSSGSIQIADTAVSAGTYTLSTITVNSRGQITAASDGTAGSGTVTSAGAVGANGVTIAGSPITTAGAFTIGLLDITPRNVTASGAISGTTGLFTGKVSAEAGINTTTISANSIGVTGDINAAAGTVLASAATITGLLTGATATFSGIVSANSGLRATTVSASGVIGGSNLSGTNTGDQTITLTGDVSGSGTGSFAATINPASVTNAKMANMAAFTIKSNIVSSAAIPADNTLSAIIDATLSGAAWGDVLYRGNGTWTKLVAGTSGQYFRTAGVSANPFWSDETSTGTVTSVALSGGGGISVAGSPITSTGTISLGLGAITPTSITTGAVSASTASFSGMVSANAGLRATTVSASGVIGGSNLSGTNTGDQTITLSGDVSGSGTGAITANVIAASTTQAGKIEIATSAETNTGTDNVRAISPLGLATSNYGVRVIGSMLTDPSPTGTAVSASNRASYVRIPSVMNNWRLVGVAAHLATAGSAGGGQVRVQMRNITNSTIMLSTALTIDATTTDSVNASAAAVINAGNATVSAANEIAMDISAAGGGARGLYVEMQYQL